MLGVQAVNTMLVESTSVSARTGSILRFFIKCPFSGSEHAEAMRSFATQT